MLDRIRRLIREAHRRSLWQVLGLYVVGSWVGYEVILELAEGVGLPRWVPPFAIVLFIIGLPLVLATAFVQEGLPMERGSASSPTPVEQPGGSGDQGGDADSGADDRQAPGREPVPQRPGRAHRILTWPRAITAGVLAFALLGLGTTGFLAMRSLGIGPVGTLVAKGELDGRTPLVMAGFTALSGDSSLAAVVTEGLRADLEQSRFVTVADRTRIDETLRLMMRTPGSRLDPTTAQEVAIRLGLKAVIEGDVGRAGGGYILTARVVTADSGRTLATFRETASDSTGLVPAIGALSHDLRERIGESLKTVHASPPLTQVTTASLPALRLAVEATHEEQQGNRPRAIRLMNEAVRLDPGFSWAWVGLAIFHYNDNDRSATLDAIDRALEHADRLDENRRVYARGFQASILGDLPTAVQEGRESVLLDSTNAKSWISLSDALWNDGEWDEAARAAERGVALDPKLWVGHWNLIVALLDGGRTSEAANAVRRGMQELPQLQSLVALDAMTLAADARWDSIHALGVDRHAPLVAAMADRVLGRWAEATRDLATLDSPDRDALLHWSRTADRVLVLGDTGAVAWLRTQLDSTELAGDQIPESDLARIALLTAIAGDGKASQAARQAYEARVPERVRWGDAWLYHAADGFLALHAGHAADALAALRKARESTRWTAPVDALLGRVYDSLGQRDSAIAAYSRYLDTPWSARGMPSFNGFFDPTLLVPTHERLAVLYQQAGNTSEAVRHASAVVQLWHDADPELQPQVTAARRILEHAAREAGSG